MAKIIHKTTERMTRLCRKIVPVDARWSILEKVSFIGRFFHFIWDRILVCSVCKPARYRRLALQDSPLMPATATIELDGVVRDVSAVTDSDLVSLKISLLGDCDIGKTSFVIKYVGDEQEKRSLQMKGLNLMDKTFFVEGARISFSIWDVAGDKGSSDQIPMACKDAVAILFMFDLTSRSTLNKKSPGRFKQSIRSVFGQKFESVFRSVVGWFSEARKWNQTALPILIGTKFDDFVRLPPDVQWTIVTQARAYARAMQATLFFSSATHNINVNKIFKFIMAKLFNLPWKLERNLTLGEPIIDFSS